MSGPQDVLNAKSRSLPAGLGAWIFFLVGCTPGAPSSDRVNYTALHADYQDLISARDSLFRSAATPLLEADRATFQGLSYFAYDSSLAFRLPLQPTLARDTIRMVTSTGEARPFIPYGTFRFDAGGRGHTLAVFKPVGEDATPGHLFLPFTDQTSGRSTYGGGRYIDLSEDATGVFTLDFNLAYHPYCVYNPLYSCPVPPAENRLRVAIAAGERLSDPI